MKMCDALCMSNYVYIDVPYYLAVITLLHIGQATIVCRTVYMVTQYGETEGAYN